ncbi:uncharacterized protein BX664DRAFT_341510 [Halteromyces radiatus]|uniref:uncharacterized protein n=1 Tax=Halteromyces radiatus TaxID=101107 RepID=UPI00221FF1D5|nr:uncharacterized protein BX664DRAFT_341510 [Halteromyces radiatus]KAI8079809.1 hypothetical protein BX664DRAFT_341510 [Halteromyces radiatus]
MTNTPNNSIWEDLLTWQKDISKQDTLLEKRKPIHNQALPSIRTPVEFIVDQKKPTGLKAIKGITGNKKTNASTMMQKAQAAKEMGNTHFQKQRYQQAIQCYSDAIDLDPTSAVYFVNRAMAHLKLNNFLQAEHDCTKCLALQPNHVKALWRRGIALRSLGRSKEARKDFEQALQLEPGNKLIIDELNKLPQPSKKKEDQPPAKQPRRQLEVKVLDEAYTPRVDVEKKKESTTPTSPAPPPPPSTSKPASPKVASPMGLSPLKLTCPRTNYEFERDWKACKRRGDDIIYQYLQCIPPSSYATLFKSSLEPDQFEKMIDIIDQYYIKNKTDKEILDVIQGLGQVPRLDMLVMFLGKQHKKALQHIFTKLTAEVPRATLIPLANKFSIDL